jgi:hypothetical protein
MLKKVSNKCVQSNCGFVVNVPNIHEIEYIENDKMLRIEIEGGTSPTGEVDWLVYSETMTGWLSPHQWKLISKEEREKIIRNVRKCLDILGMKHQIV